MDWTEINERRISEKRQEIYNYCRQRKEDMTPEAFRKAKLSLGKLLQNLSDRDRLNSGIAQTVNRSIDTENNIVARCSEKQAEALAKVVVYQGVGDDLGLYPVSGEKKVERDIAYMKRTGQKMGNSWGIDELTVKDMLYFIRQFIDGVSISTNTMPSIYKYFIEKFSLDPVAARTVACIYFPGNAPKDVRVIRDGGRLSELIRREFVKDNGDGTFSYVQGSLGF
jgi:hypothetical protein